MATYKESKKWPECSWEWGYLKTTEPGVQNAGEYLCKTPKCTSCKERHKLKENKKQFKENVRPVKDETTVKEPKKEDPTFDCQSCAHLYSEAKALAANVVRLRKDRNTMLLVIARLSRVMDRLVSNEE